MSSDRSAFPMLLAVPTGSLLFSAELLQPMDHQQLLGEEPLQHGVLGLQIETVSVHHSKQICPKPVAAESWSFESVEAHWDRLILRAYSHSGDHRWLYQEGPVTNMLAPRELIARYAQLNGELAVGTAMSCGTLPLKDAIEYADRFEIQLEDPVTQRTLSHSYHVKALPVAA